MSDDFNFKEAFNGWYFLIALGVLFALPLMHVILGWIVFYFSK